MRRLGILLALALVLGGAASDPRERLADPVREAEARSIFRQVRCMVCQNESIDDSPATLASDLRALIREQVQSGQSEAQIKAFLVQRYGEVILLKPLWTTANAALWISPEVVIGLGALALAALVRRRGESETVLTEDEETELANLVSGEKDIFVPQDGHKK